MITWLDGLLLGVMLVSGLLAMVRGFMREILSIAAWGAAAASTLYFAPRLVPTVKGYFSGQYGDIIANVVSFAGVFMGVLLLVAIITVRLSDKILDSRIGPLDRTLGFLFGLGRGLIIVVVAFAFFNWLVQPEARQPAGFRDAKSKIILTGTGEWLVSLLPDNLDQLISNKFRKRPKGDEEEPASDQRSGVEPAVPRGETVGYGKSDRTGMQQLIESKAAKPR